MTAEAIVAGVRNRLQYLRQRTSPHQRNFRGVDLVEVLMGMVEAAPSEKGRRYAELLF